MQINLLNKQNIFITKSNYQTGITKSKFNSINNDAFMKTQPSFTSVNPIEVLKPFEKFGIAEYKKLTAQQIKDLRNNLNPELIKDRNAIITLSKVIKKTLDKEHPEGYVFVSIGRSPAIIGKALEYQGVDVKYCPISSLGEYYFLEKHHNKIPVMENRLSGYYDYLKSIGLSKEKIKNDTKKYIFTDYTSTGKSLEAFANIMNHPKIDIHNSNILYKSLNDDIILKNEKDVESLNLDDLVFSYLHSSKKIKSYSHYDNLHYQAMHKVQEIISLPYSDQSKQIQFALIDYYKQKGLLKDINCPAEQQKTNLTQRIKKLFQ